MRCLGEMLVPASSGGEMLWPVCALTQWINQCLLASEAVRPGTRIGNSNAARIIPRRQMTAAAIVHYSTVAALTCFVRYWAGLVRSETMIDVQPSQQWLYDNHEDGKDKSDGDEDHMINVSFALIATARAGVLAGKGRDGRGRYKFPGCVLHINAAQKSNPLQYKSIWSVLHINAQKSNPY